MSQNHREPATDTAVADRVLTDGDVAAIAEATAAKLAEIVGAAPATFALVDARQLASELGVSLDYVYAHARELGAMRLGSGPKARIRFDLDRARQALEARCRPWSRDGKRASRGEPTRAPVTNRGGGSRSRVRWPAPELRTVRLPARHG